MTAADQRDQNVKKTLAKGPSTYARDEHGHDGAGRDHLSAYGDKLGHDGVDGPTEPALNAKAWSLAHHQRGDRP
jgi:hypothetical protein